MKDLIYSANNFLASYGAETFIPLLEAASTVAGITLVAAWVIHTIITD